jgi:Flavin containing amine oxidoreductase
MATMQVSRPPMRLASRKVITSMTEFPEEEWCAKFCLLFPLQLTGLQVPQEYVDKEVTDLHGDQVFGVDACIAEAFDPFRKALVENFHKGWEEVMKYDWASTTGYLVGEKPKKYPLSVAWWMETRDSGTGGFDRALSEVSASPAGGITTLIDLQDILESLDFNDPTQKVVPWRCLEGGTHVLIDAMLAKLKTKPSYNLRVTAVEMRTLLLPRHFPNVSGWPRWARFRRFPLMKVKVSGERDEYFTHVVSTSTFGTLRAIDTSKVPMSYRQREAMRTLNYGPAVKVAIKFKSRWWEQAGRDQRGGSSYTDRQSRVVVYPSYGLGESGPGVLMVTYNWCVGFLSPSHLT